MGRPSMSAEEIAGNRIRIISGAMDMLHESGIQSVSARALGSRIGMNSALIYRFFKDIDEVILFACVHALQEYTSDMNAARMAYEAEVSEPSDEYIYTLSWEIFSRHAFANPDEYMTLFFSKHSGHLEDVISEYYKLMPQNDDDASDVILEGMYRTSNLRNRNLMVLIPVLEGSKPESEIILINDLTISYFYALLVQLTGRDQGVTPEYQLKRMMDAVRFTLKR